MVSDQEFLSGGRLDDTRDPTNLFAFISASLVKDLAIKPSLFRMTN